MPRGNVSTPGSLTRAIAEILADAHLDTLDTQRQLGAKVGMSKSSVSRTLLGERVPDVEQLTLLCRALSLDPVTVYAEGLERTGPK